MVGWNAVSPLDISITVEVHDPYFIHPFVLEVLIMSHQDVCGARLFDTQVCAREVVASSALSCEPAKVLRCEVVWLQT